jgi:hypothetical protein
MSVTARVATGIKAIHVVIAERGKTWSAIIPREALESCWDIGPDQADLLNTFFAHQDEIAAQIRHHAGSARGPVFVIKQFVDVEVASRA